MHELLRRICGQVVTCYGWAPELFNVCDDQLCPFFVADIGWLERIVHCVCEISNQCNVELSRLNHRFNRERSTKHAHIGVDTHVEQILDTFLHKDVIDLLTVIADGVSLLNLDCRVLAVPRFEAVFLAGIRTTIR